VVLAASPVSAESGLLRRCSSVAMSISEHRTADMFARYHVTDDRDQQQVLRLITGRLGGAIVDITVCCREVTNKAFAFLGTPIWVKNRARNYPLSLRQRVR
jgi:hypothetical protein